MSIRAMNDRKLYQKRILDFEIGHLVKSPCKECAEKLLFPKCMPSCAILDRIQTRLARGVSSTLPHMPWEPFSVNVDRKGEK